MWQREGSRRRRAARTKNLQFQCSGTDTVIDIDREEDSKQTETEAEREEGGAGAVLPGAVTTFTEITQKTAAGGQKFSTEAKGNVFPQIS